jgi:3-oxoacyl-[acyl-carrier-protein] synthase-1
VDSYINASSLSWLDQHWRLKTPENSDGLIPGETAAAVLLQYLPPAHTVSALKVSGIGFGKEKATVLSEEPLMAEGLTEATRAALMEAGVAMHNIAFRLSDVSGESYGFKEQALVVGRLLRVHREEPYPIWHRAENVGDIGAAAGISQLIAAFFAYKNDYAPGNRVVCFTSAVPGDRAVAVLEQTGGLAVE